MLVHLPPADQIIKRCQAAYDSVQTLEEDVASSAGTTGNGSAHISFQRPGKLRITGKTLFGQAYDVLAIGSQSFIKNPSVWQNAQSPEMAIATVTGVSGAACAGVPAQLLHTSWYEIVPDSRAHYKVFADSIRGIRCYRLDVAGQNPRSLWFDKRTGFYVKTSSTIFGQKLVVDFAPPTVNKPIPASRFRK
jgi:outer membrane lipoprotein-sorting protein